MSDLLSSAAAIGTGEGGERTGQTEAPTPDSRLRKTAKGIGWTFFAIFCLVFFTLAKLPDDRIKAYVQGQINSFLAPRGISISAVKSYVSFWFGVSYVMKDVTINLPPPQPPAHVDRLKVSPSILRLAFGRIGASISVEQGDGYIEGSLSGKNTSGTLALKAKSFDLGKTGLLPVAAGVQASAIASGKISVSGDSSIPTSLEGDVDLDLAKIALDPQTIMGFAIPRVSVSEAKIELSADKGKATIKNLRIGKGPNDDIRANVTGDLTLGKQWESSTLNARATLSLSQSILKAFVLLDALLGAGKQPDGSYAFNLNGPLTSPNPTPVGK